MKQNPNPYVLGRTARSLKTTAPEHLPGKGGGKKVRNDSVSSQKRDVLRRGEVKKRISQPKSRREMRSYSKLEGKKERGPDQKDKATW